MSCHPVVASEDFSRRNFSVECFCLICCNISTKQPISRFAFWKFRFGAIQFTIFQQRLIEDSNGRCNIHPIVLHSLDSRLRLLRLMKILLEFGLSGYAARECRLGWFRDRSGGGAILLRRFLEVSSEGWVCWKTWNDRCVTTLVWSFSPAWEAVELTAMAWRAPRWREGHNFHSGVYLPTLSTQWSYYVRRPSSTDRDWCPDRGGFSVLAGASSVMHSRIFLAQYPPRVALLCRR